MSEAPQQIDCTEVLNRLHEYIDSELTSVRTEEVKIHLADCEPCMALSQFESAFIRFLEARTRAREAPEHLRTRILDAILLEKRDKS